MKALILAVGCSFAFGVTVGANKQADAVINTTGTTQVTDQTPDIMLDTAVGLIQNGLVLASIKKPQNDQERTMKLQAGVSILDHLRQLIKLLINRTIHLSEAAHNDELDSTDLATALKKLEPAERLYLSYAVRNLSLHIDDIIDAEELESE